MGRFGEVNHKLWVELSLGFFFWSGALFDFYIAETCSTKQLVALCSALFSETCSTRQTLALNPNKEKAKPGLLPLLTLMLRV